MISSTQSTVTLHAGPQQRQMSKRNRIDRHSNIVERFFSGHSAAQLRLTSVRMCNNVAGPGTCEHPVQGRRPPPLQEPLNHMLSVDGSRETTITEVLKAAGHVSPLNRADTHTTSTFSSRCVCRHCAHVPPLCDHWCTGTRPRWSASGTCSGAARPSTWKRAVQFEWG